MLAYHDDGTVGSGNKLLRNAHLREIIFSQSRSDFAVLVFRHKWFIAYFPQVIVAVEVDAVVEVFSIVGSDLTKRDECCRFNIDSE